MKLDAKALRELKNTDKVEKALQDKPRYPVYLILDNIYDTYNIGGLFRLADALHISRLYICGDSETPPNHKIKKASIGTYKVVPWAYEKSTVTAIEKLREEVADTGEKLTVVAVELDDSSVPYTEFEYTTPIAFVVGHETNGVSKKVINACDATIEMPMHGINVSLNVIVSAAIAMYHAYTELDNIPQKSV